ncbi:MAG: hypothetical protein RhofKO_20510 [Rhodothermales bacterium]
MNTRLLSLLTLLFAFTLITACDSNDLDDDHDDHAEVEGLMLRANGQTLVTIDEGEVSGSITVPAGDETALIIVEFMDHDGEEVHVDEDPELSLGYSIADPDMVEWEQHDGEDYEFHLKGLSTGTTTLVLELLHGDHADFRTPAITVVVE